MELEVGFMKNRNRNGWVPTKEVQRKGWLITHPSLELQSPRGALATNRGDLQLQNRTQHGFGRGTQAVPFSCFSLIRRDNIVPLYCLLRSFH